MLLLLACAHRPVDVSLVTATIGPSASDFSPWDGIGTVPPDVRAAAIAAAAGIDPAAGVATVAFVSALEGVAPPAPAGELFVRGGEPTARVAVAERSDTFVPAWSDVTLRDVLLAPDQRLVLRLVDIDLDSPDPIGTVEIGPDELRRALGKREGLTLDTAERTNGQLLSVTLRVERVAKR